MSTARGKADIRRRDELVMDHLDLVRILASRLGRRLPQQVELSELVSVGVLGLIDAANRFEPATGVPFDAFARRRVHGAMLDALRRLDWVPRSVREQRRAYDAAVARLRQSAGREPNHAELAKALRLSAAEYDRMLDRIRHAELAALQPLDDRRPDDVELPLPPDVDQHTRLERLELKRWLAVAVTRLSERERRILTLSYIEERTLAEIGRQIGVGESRVSQLRSRAIARLRSSLSDWLDLQQPAFTPSVQTPGSFAGQLGAGDY